MAIAYVAQSIVLGASRDSVLRHIYASMPLRRFLLADRLAPEALRPLASQLLFGDPLSWGASATTSTSRVVITALQGLAEPIIHTCSPFEYNRYSQRPGHISGLTAVSGKD
eukprot:COSAG01_NODE_1656_length_9595_cov_4.929150_3_plen_111_part_00